MPDPVWFWQRIVSPHMAGLAAAMAADGREVTYVAEEELSADRASMGWHSPDLGHARLLLARTAEAARSLARGAPANSVHICQGFRGNGLVGVAQLTLAERGLRQWVVMETVDDAGWQGPLKRLEYRRLVEQWQPRIDGVLAIGHATSDWLIARNMPRDEVFPFAYFLSDQNPAPTRHDPSAPFRFLFVGRLVQLKRVDLLLRALGELVDVSFEVVIVGAGPVGDALLELASEKLPGRVHWHGQQPISVIPTLMADADCLVLPSRYDGWGAVVSEALLAGTPAICSAAVGAAGVVRASASGGVFPTGDQEALAVLLRQILSAGRQTPEGRAGLADWGRRLGAKAGASYLDAILSYSAGGGTRPVPPWLEVDSLGAQAMPR